MRDIEKALDPIDIARYENARWWRNVNRTMSVIGLLIIAAIVSPKAPVGSASLTDDVGCPRCPCASDAELSPARTLTLMRRK